MFFQLIINLGYSFKTLSLHIVDGLLENNTNHMHIDKCLKIARMDHDGNVSNLKTQVFQTNI